MLHKIEARRSNARISKSVSITICVYVMYETKCFYSFSVKILFMIDLGAQRQLAACCMLRW